LVKVLQPECKSGSVGDIVNNECVTTCKGLQKRALLISGKANFGVIGLRPTMEDAEKFPERAMHRSQRFGKSEPPDACLVDSLDTESSGGDSGSDASMTYMQDFMATRPQRRRSGNGGQGQHRC